MLIAGGKIYYRYSMMELCSKSLATVTSHTAIDNSPASLGLIIMLTRLMCSTLQKLAANEGRPSTEDAEQEQVLQEQEHLPAVEQVNLLPAEQEPFVAEQGQVPLLAAEQEPLMLFVAELEQECQQETGPPLPAELVIGR